MFYIQKTNNKQQQIQRKISSLTLMAIMVAGGMTFAVPGMVPQAYAANANLFVSAENSLFDNYMAGPQVIEVAIIDSSIADTNEGKGEPDVTINGNQLRMAQATDGNWYGYFADYAMATAADNDYEQNDDQGLNFGTFSPDGNQLGFTNFEADGLFYNDVTKPTNVVREEKNLNNNVNKGNNHGQISLDDTEAKKWPFIQLYKLSQGGNVVVQYNKGGGAQSTTLTFDTVDDYAGIMLDRSSYPQGAQVHATITDAWLNIDPTDEDSWTFNTVNGTAFYHIYNDNGGNGENTKTQSVTGDTDVSSVNVGDLMCSDCALKLKPNVQGDDKHVITIQDNADSQIANEGDNSTTANARLTSVSNKEVAVKQLEEGTQPVTITEQGPNSGIFGTYDEADISVLKIIDDAERGTSATIDYNDSPVTVLVTHAFAEIDIQPASAVWNSGELIPVVLVDADVNKNSRADEDITLSDPSFTIIPSLRTGSPITLGSGADSDGNIEVAIGETVDAAQDANGTTVSVDAFSDRAILNITDKNVKALLIDLGITGKELKSSLVDTNDGNYGYNLFNYDIRALAEGEKDSLGTVKITLVNTDNGTIINVPLACDKSDRQGLELLPAKECELPKSTNTTPSNGGTTTPVDPTPTTPEPIVIPLLYSGSPYESQHFGTAFDKAVSDYNATQTSKVFSSEKLDLGTTPIQSVLDTGAVGAVGTYTSEQLRVLNDTGKIGTDDGDIVLLSYSSAAQSFAKSGDGIFRLTTDTSRQVSSVVTQLIPTGTFDNVISIHLNDAWSNDYVAALEATYGDDHRTIAYDTAYDTTTANMTAQFRSVLTDGTTGLSDLDSRTAIVILEFDHDRLDALITELARTGAYAGITTTQFIIPDVPSGAFGITISADALDLLKSTEMKTIKFALSGNTADQTALKDALLKENPDGEVKLDGDELFDRHAYSAYDAGQILAKAIDGLGKNYTSAELAAAIPTAAAAYSSDALIYRTVLDSTTGDLECMVYDIFEINDVTSGFILQDPTQLSTNDTNCPVTSTPTPLTPTVPGAPTITTANHRDGEVVLSWTAPSTGDAPTSYKVQYKLATANSWTDGPTVTAPTLTATVTGLTNDQAHDFRVIAINNTGESTPSVEDTATPSAQATAPLAPTGLTATAGDTTVSLSWTAPDDGGSAITDYKVEHKTATERTWTTFNDGTSNSTETTVTGLTNGQEYQFQVSATNSEGTGAISDIVLGTPKAPVDPNVPNVAPVITPITSSQAATVGEQYTLTIVATDANPADTTFTYSAAAPQGVTSTYNIVPRTGVFTWTPDNTDVGDKVFSFTAMDDAPLGSAPVEVTITVSAAPNGQTPVDPNVPNVAPVITPITSSQAATVGEQYTLTIVATDANPADTTFTYSAAAPQGVTSTYNIVPRTGVFTWTPVTADIGDKVFTFTATDDGPLPSAPVQVTITVSAAPQANNDPVFKSVIPQSTTVGAAVSFTVEATDADTNDDLDYDLVGQIGAFNGNTRIFTWTPTTAGTENIVFTVDDGNGGTDRLTVQITVYPVRVAFTDTINIPILYLNVAGNYEQQFADAVTNAVNDYQFGDDSISSTQNYYDQRYNITTGTTADIDTIVNAGHKGTVGTYTSEQLEQYKDESRIVFLSYASTASTLTEDTDNIFRLTVDNKRQTADVLKPLLDEDGIVNVISIHRHDAWSDDFVSQLEAAYGNNHRDIQYDPENIGTIATALEHATTGLGTIAPNTAIVILGFGEVDEVVMALAAQTVLGTYDYTNIETTNIYIPDLSASVPADLNDVEIALLKATDMKTIKFALSDDAQAYHDTANSGNEYSDRHVYAAYDAAQILARSIDQLGKEYTAEQLKTKIPEVARAYSDDALIHRTVLDANGDLECMVYDVLEIADDATAADFTYKDAAPKTTDATNCPISAGTSSSSTVLSNPQTVSCIDCAINSFGEIFGQTVQVDQQANHTTITNILEIHDDSELAILIEYQNPVTTDSEDDPIVLDFFAFGFGDDGRTANQIVRLELEETGDNTNTFTGGLEYTMLNQLNILDADTYTGLSPISDEPTFIVMEDLTDEDSPRVNYFDKGADGVDTQIADQQAAPSHSGVVALDSDNYKVADTVTITLTDADLNVDSDLIDIFTTVEKGDLANIVGKDVSMSYGKNITESGAPLGRVLDVTFDDELWTPNNCGVNDALHSTGFTLIETGTATGVFTGSFQIPTMYCPTEINDKVNEDGTRVSVTGTDIEVNYLDYRDASGEIIEVGDSAGVRASTGSVSFDRTVYPVPFAGDKFPLHPSINEDGEAFKKAEETNSNAKYLSEGKVAIHVRVSDPDYDISASGEDVIAENNATNMNVDGTANKVGPVIVTVSRGSASEVVATAGAKEVTEADTIGDNAKEYGPIKEIAPDAGIFEADITISYKDGPHTDECPVEFNTGCILQGDIITVQYNDPTDASGDANTITDSATFDLRNAVLQSDKSVYIIGSDMILTLIEPDFDLDSDGAETYSLDLIEWDSDAGTTSMGKYGTDAAAFDPEPADFRETGDSTGIFQVVVEIPEALGDDKLERGEEIELEYTDWGPSGSNYVGEEDEDISLTVFTSNFGSTVELDQKVYTWTDKVYITIVAPDHNFDSDLIDEIGNSDDDPIRIATRSADLDNYKLVETGTDTGIFTGEVILTGFTHDANGDGDDKDSNPRTGDGNGNIKGLGPTNGFLETEDDDGLSVSFEFSEDETVIASSLIRWNIGEVQWLEASYAASGTGLVRVVDPDMNLNPESVNNFEIDIWSDTHAGGIDLTVTETNQATGIFEGTVFFTVTDESSGHRLRVSEGDTVTAEYEDRTLPDPHDTSDKIDISATTQIGSIIPPLERAPATNLRVVDAFSNTLDTISVDSQVQITADLANGQDKDQPFAYIVQIQDSSSVTVALAWVSGTLTPSQSFSPALSWTPSEAGTYTATAFVWESVDNPTALSPPNELTITVN